METIKTGIKNISKVENSLDNSSRFESLNEELLDYQFQYVEKLEKTELVELKEQKKEEYNDFEIHEKELEASLDSNFKKKLFKYTSLYDDLFDKYKERVFVEDIKNIEEQGVFDEWFKNILNEINIDYVSGNKDWKNNIQIIIKNELDKIGSIINKLPEDSEEFKIGLIHFNLKEADDLEKFGIDSTDRCLSLHFKDLFKQKKENENINNIFSGESLSLLALKIIDKYPDVKAIVGYSWLVNSPIGKRIGFNTYKEHKKITRNSGFWGQFINEKGEINKKRMQKFLDTGIPEFFPSEGFIGIEDFLKRYLPKENKGIVRLNGLTKDSKEFKKNRKKTMEILRQDLDSFSYEYFEQIVNESVLSDFFKTSEGQELMGFVKKAKELNLKSLDELKEERVKFLKKQLGIYIEEKENQYIEKEVLIN